MFLFKIFSSFIFIISADINNSPFNLGMLGGLPGMESMGFSSANFMELQQRMQRELLDNPDMLRNLVDSPMVQQMMSDPAHMRQLILANPQMQQLVEVIHSNFHFSFFFSIELFHFDRDIQKLIIC